MQVCWQVGMSLADMEREVILAAYKMFGNNKTKTAQALGISIRNLDNKLDTYDKRESVLRAQQEADDAREASRVKAAQGNFQ